MQMISKSIPLQIEAKADAPAGTISAYLTTFGNSDVVADIMAKGSLDKFIAKFNPTVIDGIIYAHYLTSGAMGRPISGDNHARSLLLKGHMSATVGHSHFFDFSTHVAASGRRMMGLVAGSFKGPKNDAYAGTSARNYWRGVCVKRMVEDGTYDLQMVSMAQLEELYKT